MTESAQGAHLDAPPSITRIDGTKILLGAFEMLMAVDGILELVIDTINGMPFPLVVSFADVGIQGLPVGASHEDAGIFIYRQSVSDSFSSWR